MQEEMAKMKKELSPPEPFSTIVFNDSGL